jgi:hypothetical protein
MFGGRRKKITLQTIEMAKQPYAMFQNIYGVPAHFWTDEFVLGYFAMMTGVLCKFLGGDKLSQADRGYVLLNVFAALSNTDGSAILQHSTELSLKHPKSDAHELGCDNGVIVTLAAFGKVSSIGQEAVLEAKTIAASQGNSEVKGAVETILMTKLFIEPLLERFNLDDT